MKNAINRDEAIRQLNKCFKSSSSYNEAITKFFEGFICDWMKINPSLLPSDPQRKLNFNEDGSERVLQLQNIITEALLSINQ